MSLVPVPVLLHGVVPVPVVLRRKEVPQFACRVCMAYVLAYFFMIDFQNTLCNQSMEWRTTGGRARLDEENIFLKAVGGTPATFVLGWVIIGVSYTIVLLLAPYTWPYTSVVCVAAALATYIHHTAACTWWGLHRTICLSHDKKGLVHPPATRNDGSGAQKMNVAWVRTLLSVVMSILPIMSILFSWTIVGLILWSAWTSPTYRRRM